MQNWIGDLKRDLQSPIAVRRFGTGWFAGFFAVVLAASALCLVISLRWPSWFAMPELAPLRDWTGFRAAVHAVLITAYALALLSLLLRPRKAIGATALVIALAASLLGGANVLPQETRDWGVFFGIDFFAVNLVATGLMFAPLERWLPLRPDQRLFRQEWREDLFYFLVSSMMVQLITFLALAPSTAILANTGGFAEFRQAIAAQPWALQLAEIMLLTDLAQYWVHRAFHRVPFLWGFHAIHHSPKTMDWLAGSRLHFFEIVLVRSITTLPLFTLGFAPSAMQAYVAFVYVYGSLIHANLSVDFDRLGQFLVTPRYHHWHHAIEAEGVDRNFAFHFPLLDRLFGTYHFPAKRWPTGYGVPESVPVGYLPQLLYPFRRRPH